ncbi:MAG: DUF4340 domain-containing protein [Pseudomonadota bacterium]
MKQKSFLMLAGATGLSILAAGATLFSSGNAPAFAEAGERLFPELEQKASEVAKLELRDGAFEMTIELRDGTFVDAASGYPVDLEPLKKLVSGMTLAEIAEAKTSDPARHADLELAAAGAETGSGSEVVLFDDGGDQIAHVIAGQRDFTLGGVTGGQYVRRGGEDASWLVHARLDPPSNRAGWFETRLMDVDSSEISSVSLTTSEGQVISMTGTDGSLSIDPLLMDGRAPAENNLSRIVRLIETLDFTNVRASQGSEDGGASIQTTLADDTTVTLTALTASESDSEAQWFRINAIGGTDISEALAGKVDGFEFSMSSADAEIFGWTLDDLTEQTPS